MEEFEKEERAQTTVSDLKELLSVATKEMEEMQARRKEFRDKCDFTGAMAHVPTQDRAKELCSQFEVT